MATASKIVIVKQPYVQRTQILKLVNSVWTVNVTNTIANRITEKKKNAHAHTECVYGKERTETTESLQKRISQL